jgi:hypothetical protein
MHSGLFLGSSLVAAEGQRGAQTSRRSLSSCLVIDALGKLIIVDLDSVTSHKEASQDMEVWTAY